MRKKNYIKLAIFSVRMYFDMGNPFVVLKNTCENHKLLKKKSKMAANNTYFNNLLILIFVYFQPKMLSGWSKYEKSI